MKKNITNSAEETKELAAKIVGQLKGGEVIGLVGELGAGKTVFVQGLAEGLGISEVVNSPTFVLMKTYEVESRKSKVVSLIHVDVYRLSNSQELKEIGIEEYLGQKDTVVVIEWAEKVEDLLPEGSMMIHFDMGKGESQRVIESQINH